MAPMKARDIAVLDDQAAVAASTDFTVPVSSRSAAGWRVPAALSVGPRAAAAARIEAERYGALATSVA